MHAAMNLAQLLPDKLYDAVGSILEASLGGGLQNLVGFRYACKRSDLFLDVIIGGVYPEKGVGGCMVIAIRSRESLNRGRIEFEGIGDQMPFMHTFYARLPSSVLHTGL